MDAKVGIGVKVVVPRRHFLRADKLGYFASTGTGGQSCYMRRVGDTGHVVGSRHWFGHRGGLGRLRKGGSDRLLPLLGGKKERKTSKELSKTTDKRDTFGKDCVSR